MDPKKYRLVVASGPTREWLDPVRFISNPSSGKTGWHLASCGIKKFREVIFISGPGSPEYRTVEGAQNKFIETTEEMAEEVWNSLLANTVLIMAAAPADFHPVKVQHSKIKKKLGRNLTLKLKPTIDILHSAGTRYGHLKNFIRIGFAAETDSVFDHAMEKLKRKKADYICANQVHREQKGFGENINTLMIIDKSGLTRTFGPDQKEVIAEKLIDYLIRAII